MHHVTLDVSGFLPKGEIDLLSNVQIRNAGKSQFCRSGSVQKIILTLITTAADNIFIFIVVFFLRK